MRILSIQSHVAYGHVGNSAAVFPLQRLGHEVWPVLTVNFSNHTGYGAWRGPLIDPADVTEVIQGIEDRGVLPTCDAVLSGYQGSPAVAGVVVDAVRRVKAANPAADLHLRPGDGQRDVGLLRQPGDPADHPRAGRAGGRRPHAQPVRARLPHRHRPPLARRGPRER